MTTTSTELASQYKPSDVENEVADRWSAANAFHADPNASGDPYCIVIPPPNVTSALHLGHALNNTLQDILTRYHRMLGDRTLWMPGTDHAGIATQTVVDKRLQQEGKKALKDYKRDEADGRQTDGKTGREQFIDEVKAWKDVYEKRITGQLVEMGCSCDWDRQRFTMDEVCAAAVREAFFKLFKDGLIYRGKRLVNWDPVTQTALADDEVESQDIDGNFYYLKYPLVTKSGEPVLDDDNKPKTVTVATTRPETMLGDTAVAVNPKDPKARSVKGLFVRLPIVNRIIPIIEDDYVVMADTTSDDAKARMASGFLKVTPAHDPNDYAIGQRHNLGVINVMAPDASISKDHGWPEWEWEGSTAIVGDFAKELLGQSREDARKAIIIWFKENNLLQEIKPHRHAVGHSYRSHVPVEPYLSDQWYVAVTKQIESLAFEGNIGDTEVAKNSLAGLALQAQDKAQLAGENAEDDAAWQGKLKFTPARYAKTFQTWHENIRDWCISRQLWWGHRIPVWASPEGMAFDDKDDSQTLDSTGRVALQSFGGRWFVCIRDLSDTEAIAHFESKGFTQDPDVLDTWFSSALWPMSTLGWPNPDAFINGTSDGSPGIPEGSAALEAWNPTNTLCTAREIITLWVSRMVMFNLYFSQPAQKPDNATGKLAEWYDSGPHLPYSDVFIHAMIQDGHGQKMSKSLGNGVDPADIIHSHGSDAMRLTLASMTTQTQDVRMPVDMICPHTGETFTPKFTTTPSGHRVAAPVQKCPSKPELETVSSFGLASGQATPTAEMPLARNTSEKFDFGRNFANKLWNATRFALSNLEAAANEGEAAAAGDGKGAQLVNGWILSRLAETVTSADASLARFEFKPYVDGLYDFVWRDLCDWYIEAVKPTLRTSKSQQQTLAAVLDVTLRLLHPAMPFITEKLWERLNAVAPDRSLQGVTIPASELLVNAPWPKVDSSLIDERSVKVFNDVRDVISAIRQVRTQHKKSPRETLDVAGQAPGKVAIQVFDVGDLIESLANVRIVKVGAEIDRPEDAASAVVGDIEIYVMGLVDSAAEKDRLTKQLEAAKKDVQRLRGRLSNENYVKKAPAKLVEQTQNELADKEREVETLGKQVAELG